MIVLLEGRAALSSSFEGFCLKVSGEDHSRMFITFPDMSLQHCGLYCLVGTREGVPNLSHDITCLVLVLYWA